MNVRQRGRIGGLWWLMVFRVLLGGANSVDGLSKLGLIASNHSVSDFQPSPLGWFSAFVQLLAGMFVLVGLQTRTACAVLAAHLALGLLLARLHGAGVGDVPNLGPNALFMLAVLLAGGRGLSIDTYFPDALARYLRPRPEK